MEESKNLNNNLERKKIHLKTIHKSVNFNDNNFSKLVPSILNLNDSNEKNNTNSNINNSNTNNIYNLSLNNFKNIYTSPIKQNIIKPFRKNSFQIPVFYTSFKKHLKEIPINSDNSQNNYATQNVNTMSNSIQTNQMSLKRTNTNSLLNPRLSAFIFKNNKALNNKLMNKIKFRNSKNLDLEGSNLVYMLKSEGEEKRRKTVLLTDRNKKEIKFNNNMSRKSSISSNYKIKSSIVKNRNFIYRRTNTITHRKILDKKSNFQKKNKINSNKNFIPSIVNPLLVSEEDKIFDEMKKYLCFKYEQRKLKTKSKEDKKHHEKKKISSSKIKKIKNKLQTADKIKLDYLYLNTTKINKKIRYIKRKKDRQDLAEYQNNLLDIIKPSISDYTYEHLKDRLIDIRIKNNKKYQNNYKKIKEIENEEEEIINDFNSTCVKCLRTFRRVRAQKEILHSTNLKVKLPLLNFISCLKKKKKHIKRK